MEHLYAASVVAFLTETGKTLDAMFFNLATLLKHIDNLGFVNRGLDNEGISNQFAELSADDDESITEDFLSEEPKYSFGNTNIVTQKPKSTPVGRIRARTPVLD